VPRRALLLGGLTGLGAVLVGCASTPAATTSTSTTLSTRPSTRPSAPDTASAEHALAALETTFDGRLGVYGLDTGSGASVGHRADERFLMCSTYKMLVAGAVLRMHEHQPTLLDRVVRYDTSQLQAHSPGRAPLVITVYTAPRDPKSTAGARTTADAASIVVKALTA
jgi:beta-lactamase class A